MKKSLIAGNWKMYKTPKESVEFAKELVKNTGFHDDRDILICPPFTSLLQVSEVVSGTALKLGAQNVCFEDEGAFTGEISTGMLKETGVEYIICGHSERRNIFGETNFVVNKKVRKTAEAGINPILCVGEKLEERESGKAFEVISSQVRESLEGFKQPEMIVVAYEPVWAIGTGKTATPEQAEEVHAFIRNLLAELFDKNLSESIIILYGGSVKPDNIDSIMLQKNIDGVLVGGASLKVDSFTRIIDYKA
ncbi:MAG: triose-phosphate isomerase [Candidatus Omnitrophica bacterium]|nr:triose-phosphate isomerase [Candidatus Omnitrophota bacterium]